jgi:P27 family predicted phage terminase small subunit
MNMKKSPIKQPPKHLRAAARRMWDRLCLDFCIDDSAGLYLLECACTAYQCSEDARRLVRREGLTVTDRFGQCRSHPGCAIERDARGQMISALRALKLSPEGD